MRHLRQAIRHLALLASALVVAAAIAPAAPAPAAPASAPGVTIIHASDYVPVGGTLEVAASVALPLPARSMTVRFRILSGKGALMYQHTESRYGLPAGTHLVDLRRSASALGLREGTYRLEIRVEPAGAESATVSEPLLVVNDALTPIAVAVVVRVRGAPLMGADGRPVSDPATSSATAARDEAVAATQLHAIRPDITFAMAVPPVLLDDWRRVAQGYTPPGSESAVSLEATVPAQYRSASRSLADAARSGLPFVGLPYAEPDIGGLEAMGALEDLSAQMDLGSRVASSTLHTATPGAVLDGLPMRRGTIARLEERGSRWVLVSPSAVPQSGESTPVPAVYTIEGSTVTVVVSDAQASALMSDPSSARTDLLAHLFKRASSKKDKAQPVVVVVEVGDGAVATVAHLQARLAALQRVGWVRLVSVSEAAAQRPAGPLALPEALPSGDAEAAAHWQTLAGARAHALGLQAAVDPDDPDGAACERGIMLAEHRLWSGPQRETGARYAADADRLAMSFLSKIAVTAPDVTLSGTSGKVRVSLSNQSGKVLTLGLAAAPKDMRLLQDSRFLVSAPPGETIVAVPVEVRSSLKGTLTVRLLAGSVEVASARSTVAAGFMDRLAIVGTVVLVLLVLLWYIRTKGRQAVAGIREAAAARAAGGSDRPKDAS